MTESRQWYEKPLRLVHYFLMGDKPGETAEQFADDVAELNVNAIHFDGRGQLLKDVCRLMHQRGIKVFAYHSPFIGEEVKQYRSEMESHLEWNMITAKGALSGDKGMPNSQKCCNTGFAEFTYRWIKKTIEDYDVDGLFYDGYAIGPGYCYCQTCQEKFRRQYGQDMPTEIMDGSPLSKQFKQFRYEQVAAFIKGCHEAVHSGNPEAIFYMNGPGVNRLGWCTARNPHLLRDGVDIVGSEAFEYYYPESLKYRNLWAQGATAKLNVAVGDGKPAVVFVTFTPRPWCKRALPEATLRNLTAQVIANGAGIWYESSYYCHNPSPKENQALSEAFGFFRDNEAYYDGAKSAATVALLWSTSSGDYYGVDPAEVSDWTLADEKHGEEGRNVYLSAWRGTYDMLLRAQMPFDIITDKDLTAERLARYKTIVLANTPCLSDEQCEALRRYVSQGGGLVCSYETSLYDELGNQRDDFALKDVFGVSLVKDKDFGNLWTEYNHFTLTDTEHPITSGPRQSMPSPTYAKVVKEQETGEVLGIVDMTRHPMENDPVKYPAIVARRHGKGRVVYMAGSLGERYWSANFPEIKEVIRNSVVWASQSSPLVEVDSPSEAVEVIISEQKDKKRLIIHLINYTGEMARPMSKVLPLRDIKVTLNMSDTTPAGKARTLVGKEELPVQATDKGFSVVLPELDWYEAIVFDLE